jgi:DNA-binding SARP family transcriptional activator
VDVRLLGPLEVTHAGQPLTVGGGRRRSLLALLALHPNEVLSAERLIDELWGERPPPTAPKGLQVQVSQLRKDLAETGSESVLQTRSNGYVLQINPDQVDIRRFERTLDEGTRALTRGEPARAAERLRDALAIWRGPPLADFTYEPFAQREIARLEELRLVAVEQRIEAELALGRHGRLVPELEGLVAEEPLRERLRWLLMLALYRCGRRAEALEVYREGRQAMVDELGLEPGPALRQLQTEILEDRPELSAIPDAPPEDGAQAPPAAERAPPRAAWAVLGLAAVVIVVLLVVVVRDAGREVEAPPATVLDLAPNVLAFVDPGSGAPTKARDLLGYPVGTAVAGDAVAVVTVDSPGLMFFDVASGKLVRAVSPRLRPGAVAADGDSVWVADANRGVLVQFKAGYQEPLQRVTWHRRGTHTAIAAGEGAVWLADGSRTLTRVETGTGNVTSLRVDRPLNGLTVAAGGDVWAFSTKTASVVRVDPDHGPAKPIQIHNRVGSAAAAPQGIAVTTRFVWVLNGNTATVTAIGIDSRGVEDTIPIGIDRAPTGIAAADDVVWVSNGDGTLSRIAGVRDEPESLWVGESLSGVAAAGGRLWVTTRALDQTIPGGES